MKQVPEPSGNLQSTTSAENTVLIVIEGPGDKTIRPRRPNIPLQAATTVFSSKAENKVPKATTRRSSGLMDLHGLPCNSPQ